VLSDTVDPAAAVATVGGASDVAVVVILALATRWRGTPRQREALTLGLRRVGGAAGELTQSMGPGIEAVGTRTRRMRTRRPYPCQHAPGPGSPAPIGMRLAGRSLLLRQELQQQPVDSIGGIVLHPMRRIVDHDEPAVAAHVDAGLR
jgi:hypothetical protein